MSDLMINRVLPAATATAATAGLGYLAQASYLPKVVVNFLGRAAFGVPCCAAAGLLGAGGYTTFEKVLNSFKMFKDSQETVKDEDGKETTQNKTNYLRHGSAVVLAVGVTAAVGYAAAVTGVVVGAATQVALVASVVATVAIGIHLVAKAVFSLFAGKEEEEVTPPVKSDAQKKDLENKINAHKKSEATLQAELEFAKAKTDYHVKKAAVDDAQKAYDDAVAHAGKLHNELAESEKATDSKDARDLQEAVSDSRKALSKVTKQELEEAYKKAALTAKGDEDDSRLKDAKANLEKYAKLVEAGELAKKNLREFQKHSTLLTERQEAYDHDETGFAATNNSLAGLKDAVDTAKKELVDVEKTYRALKGKQVKEEFAVLEKRLTAEKKSVEDAKEKLNKLNEVKEDVKEEDVKKEDVKKDPKVEDKKDANAADKKDVKVEAKKDSKVEKKDPEETKNNN